MSEDRNGVKAAGGGGRPQERQVTTGRESHRAPDPFVVMATQHCSEREGTHPLPEAQLLDRFLRLRPTQQMREGADPHVDARPNPETK